MEHGGGSHNGGFGGHSHGGGSHGHPASGHQADNYFSGGIPANARFGGRLRYGWSGRRGRRRSFWSSLLLAIAVIAVRVVAFHATETQSVPVPVNVPSQSQLDNQIQQLSAATGTVDTIAVDQEIQNRLSAAGDKDAVANCPLDVMATAGKTFRCSVVTLSGTINVTVTVTSSSGTVRIGNLP